MTINLLSKTAALPFLLICCAAQAGLCQKSQLMLYPSKLEFAAAAPSSSPYPFASPDVSLGEAYTAENAVFGEDGTLFFYIQDGRIYRNSGELFGTFSNPGFLKKELAIALLPGYCRVYRILYLETTPGGELSFQYIDLELSPDGVPLLLGDPVEAGRFEGVFGSLALSQIIPGTAGDRHVFIVANAEGSVYRYRLGGSMLPLEGVIATFSPADREESEVELSPCGHQLAWSAGGTAYVHDMETGQEYVLELGFRPFSGLEFIARYDCNTLYLSHQIYGIVLWRYRWGQWIVIESSSKFNRTHLERIGEAGDLLLLARSEGGAGAWWTLDTRNHAFEPLSGALPAHSNRPAAGAVNRVFALPDQIDGERDEVFFGVPPLYIEKLEVGQTILPRDFTAAAAIYSCEQMPLGLSLAGSPSSMTIKIASVSPTSGELIQGAGYLDFEASFGVPLPAVLELDCLGGVCNLFDGYLGQLFKLSIELDSRCGESRRTEDFYFRVSGAPMNAADLNFQVVPGNAIAFCPASPSLDAPCLAGTFSGMIDFTNMKGDVTFYRIQIWDVDCLSSEEHLIYDGEESVASAFGDLATIGLNSFSINGSTGHFIHHDYVDRCIRVAIEAGNACGSAEDYTYIRFDGNYFGGDDARALQAAGDDRAAAAKIKVYPNPFRHEVNIELISSTNQQAELVVLALAGQELHRQSIHLADGFNRIAFALPDLPNGIYCYYLRTDQEVFFGSVVKQ
jgi:hypothetical protein